MRVREANDGWARYVVDLVDGRFDGNQSALAQAAGVASSTVTRWIDGATPQIGALLAMCNALGIAMPELLRAAGALRDEDLTDGGQVQALSAEVVPSVADAIRQDLDLLDEAREHLLSQYELLLRLSPRTSGAGGKQTSRRTIASGAQQLRPVARGGDPKDRAEVSRRARRVREEHENKERGSE